MVDPDDDLSIIAIFFGILAGIIFVSSQYELCIAMPKQWFTGFASGMVLAVCLAILYHRRE